MKYFIYAFFLFSIISINAQTTFTISGKILDKESEVPLAGAIITANNNSVISDSNGIYKISNLALSDSIRISLLGYQDKIVNIYAKPLITFLDRKYFTIDSVQLKGKRYDIDSLINKASEKISSNYLPSDKPLKATLEEIIYNLKDTILNVNKVVYLSGPKRWFHYNIFSNPQIPYNISKNRLTNKIKQNLIHEDDEIIKENFSKILANYGDSKQKYKIIFSTFIDHEVKYFDVILIDSNIKIRYSQFAQALGYGEKNNVQARKNYISLTELQVNSLTLAISLYTSLHIESDDAEKKSFLQLQNRIQIGRWIDQAIAVGNKYAMDKFSFQEIDHHWVLKSIYHFDNLIHPFLHENIDGQYTYILRYKDIVPVAALPINIRSLDINKSLNNIIY